MSEGNLPLLYFVSGEATTSGRLPFIAGSLLDGDGLFFLLVGAADFGLFLRGFLLVGLWGFIAHNFYLFLRVDLPAAFYFLRRDAYNACRAGHCK